MNIVKNIIRYPIKGLSGEKLDKVVLKENQVMPGDREFAFARFNTKYDQKNPIYLKWANTVLILSE